MSNSEFKKGEYIVIFKSAGLKTFTGFLENFIFKQNKCSIMLYPEIDCLGSTTNGWGYIRTNENKHRWRYATAQEIAEYERIGKPYDVTTLNKEVLYEIF
jgi:hypothetical protein